MPTAGIDGRSVRVEHTFRVQSVELADIDATGLNAAADKKQKVSPVAKKVRRGMVPVLRGLESRHGDRFAALREIRKIGGRGFSKTLWCRRCSTRPQGGRNARRGAPHRSVFDVDSLDRRIGKERDRSAVRGPERARRAFGPGKRPRRRTTPALAAITAAAAEPPPKTSFSPSGDTASDALTGWRGVDFEARFERRRCRPKCHVPIAAATAPRSTSPDAQARRSRRRDRTCAPARLASSRSAHRRSRDGHRRMSRKRGLGSF